MSLILVTGGIRSGKSQFAEQLATEKSRSVLYVATGISTDPEMEERIRLHQRQRPQHWGVLESPYEWAGSVDHLQIHDVVLYDSLSAWIGNRLYRELEQTEQGQDMRVPEMLLQEVQQWLDRIREIQTTFIVVTDETGMGGVALTPLGRQFQDRLGKANQLIAGAADEVYMVISGIPWRIKG